MDVQQQANNPGPRKATVEDVDRVMRELSLELETLIAVEPVQLSLPVDGKGPRVRVSVRPGAADSVPKAVELVVDDERVRIPLEVAEDFQEYRPLGH